MVDVICYLCKDENLSSPSSAVKSPVSVLLPKLPGLVRHIEPSSRCSGCTQEYNLHHPIILDEATDFFNKHGVSDFTFDTCRLWGWRCRAKLAVSLSSVVCFSTLDFEEGFSRSGPWFNPLFGSNLILMCSSGVELGFEVLWAVLLSCGTLNVLVTASFINWCVAVGCWLSLRSTECVAAGLIFELCTLEFETRCASYYWLLDALSLYQPYVWEYSQLNVTNTVMSKCKLNRLVKEKQVDGWDDPRLMTLSGLRRRGVTSTSINAFVQGIGITRSDSSMINVDCLEYHIREELNKTAPRTMVVLHALKIEVLLHPGT
ncbi:hypothetical protein LOK49_Contig274G00005 [Camellia lanceoleosa]|nr:hypothetical protein LOK49_Contig274G00005 [Camellia lanceoleosa]